MKKWTKPILTIQHVDMSKVGDASKLSDEELAVKLEAAGYQFKNPRVYRSKPHYIMREIAGESILVSVGDGVADFCGIVKLNASAKVVWNTLQNGTTKTELIQALIDVFHISEERAKSDAEKSLELLAHKRMISCE
jgi:hypothetical protein